MQERRRWGMVMSIGDDNAGTASMGDAGAALTGDGDVDG